MTAENDIEWLIVEPGSVWLGSDDGRLSLHPVKYHPRHEVRIDYTFEISKLAYPLNDLLKLSGIDREQFEQEGLRPPSEGEWLLAHTQGLVEQGDALWEKLADERPRTGFWEQRCDGQPRKTNYKVKLELMKKWGSDGHETSYSTEITEAMKGKEVTRIVRAPQSSNNPPRLPIEDKRPFFIREILFTVLVGIIPSILWAYNFASSEYLTGNWTNIIGGGIFISLASGFVWRPKTASYRVSSDGISMKKK
ncbi:MAG: hypothetical protein P8Q39_01950 [Candidatus Thalassarchaeaceae archaeon]|nr:hypothetical protein [Candidatus Thalassarchaeaceae archaeon]